MMMRLSRRDWRRGKRHSSPREDSPSSVREGGERWLWKQFLGNIPAISPPFPSVGEKVGSASLSPLRSIGFFSLTIAALLYYDVSLSLFPQIKKRVVTSWRPQGTEQLSLFCW